MGFLQRLSTTVTPARMRAESFGSSYRKAFWAGDPIPELWSMALSSAGVAVTPELAMTLSAMYSGVTMISLDLATLPAQTFALRDDGGKDRLRPFYGEGIDTSGGVRSLAYMLRWQPNGYQTATEFWMGMFAQLLLRSVAYAEIVSGRGGFNEALLPRHPDRVTPERLPSGRMRYKLTEFGREPRYLTQDEMFVIRDLSLDGGITSLSRVQFGAQTIGTALATQRAAAKFFKSGMTAALLATHPGEMDEDEEKRLHGSLTRYAAGVENSFGMMLVPDDVKVTNLAIEPEKAQMMLAQEWGVREVARLLRLPGSKLGIKDSVSYNSQVQAALDYVITCLRPLAIMAEQAVQRDLILRKDTFVVEFQLAALLRGDFESQANYIEKLIRNRVMRPSEARLILNMNPDARLDALSERDFQPGAPSGAKPRESDEPPRAEATGRPALSSRAHYRYHALLRDNAVRCLRRERGAIEKLAKKHAADVPGWQASLRDFYADHAGYIAETMRLPIGVARGYAAQHGTEFEAKGVVLIDGKAGEEWERFEADALAELAAEDGERQAA